LREYSRGRELEGSGRVTRHRWRGQASILWSRRGACRAAMFQCWHSQVASDCRAQVMGSKPQDLIADGLTASAFSIKEHPGCHLLANAPLSDFFPTAALWRKASARPAVKVAHHTHQRSALQSATRMQEPTNCSRFSGSNGPSKPTSASLVVCRHRWLARISRDPF
jgi:hypothetical protein